MKSHVTALIALIAVVTLSDGSVICQASRIPVSVHARILELEDKRSLGNGELKALLDDPNPAIRQRAALAIGRIGDKASTADLNATLKSEKIASVRSMIAFGLGEIEDPAAIDTLLETLKNKSEAANVISRAAEALGKIAVRENDERRALISNALIESLPDPARRLTPVLHERALLVLTALMRLRSTVSVEPLTRWLASPDVEARAWAANALFRLRLDIKSAVPALTKAAGDRDWLVKSNAARALGTAGDASALDTLLTLLKDPDERVVINAVRGLAALKDTRALERLIDAGDQRIKQAESDPSRLNTLLEIATALGTFGDQRSLPLLTELRKLRGVGGEIEIETAVAKISEDAFLAGIDEGVGRLKEWKRAANVAQALGQLKSDKAKTKLSTLYSIYDQTGSDARAMPPILRAMNESKVSGFEEAFHKQLNSLDKETRSTAAQLLGQPPAARDPERKPLDVEYYQRVARAAQSVLYADLHTSKGLITIQLFTVDAPLTVENFATLTSYFEGSLFHRVVPTFVIQDGDRTGTGEGGPGYRIRCEVNLRPYLRGTVGMALSGKDTGGSQYFITHSPQPHLDGGYTVFGQVISGMDVVDRIVRGDEIRQVVVRRK